MSICNLTNDTFVDLAVPSAMTSIQTNAIARQMFISTMVRGDFKILQKYKVAAMVSKTANSDIEHPIVEISSNAFLFASEI